MAWRGNRITMSDEEFDEAVVAYLTEFYRGDAGEYGPTVSTSLIELRLGARGIKTTVHEVVVACDRLIEQGKLISCDERPVPPADRRVRLAAENG